MKKLTALLALCFCWFGHAFGQTCSGDISNATFAAITSLTPGTYTTAATLSVTCSGFQSTDTVAICPDLGEGTGGSNGSSQRLLTGSNGGTLAFQIFSNTGSNIPWGSVGSYGASNIPLLSQTGNGTQSRTLYLSLNTTGGSTTPGTYSSIFNANIKYGAVASVSPGCSGLTLTNMANAQFTVTTTLSKSCLVNVTQNINFGAHAAFKSNVDSTGGLSVQCTNNTPHEISLDLGLGGATDPSARKMRGPGSDTLVYGLYRDAARALIWGNTLTSGGNTQSGSNTGGTAYYTVYGRVPPQATPAAGAYSDMVVVTVTY